MPHGTQLRRIRLWNPDYTGEVEPLHHVLEVLVVWKVIEIDRCHCY